MKRTIQERLVAGLLDMGYTDAGIRGKYRHFKRGTLTSSLTGRIWIYPNLFVGKSGALRYGSVPSRSRSVGGGDRSGGFYQSVLERGDSKLAVKDFHQ